MKKAVQVKAKLEPRKICNTAHMWLSPTTLKDDCHFNQEHGNLTINVPLFKKMQDRGGGGVRVFEYRKIHAIRLSGLIKLFLTIFLKWHVRTSKIRRSACYGCRLC